MRPNTLTTVLKGFIKMNKNVIIEGSPGIGKTVSVKAAVQQLGEGFHVIFKHGPTMQPEDIALPFRDPDNGRLDFARAGWIPLAGDYPEDDHVVVVIDELPQAATDVQKTVANLIQEREAYGIPLHRNTSFIATGNRAADRAGANRILSHLRNRMITLPFDTHIDDWSDWAYKNDIPVEVISFLQFKTDMLNKFDPQNELNPTPRMWSENVSDIVRMVEAGTFPPEAELEAYTGCVGEGPAVEFKAFMQLHRELPHPDTVLAQAASFKLPTKQNILFALCGAIAHRADKGNMDAVATLAERMAPEFGVMIMLNVARRDPTLQNTKGYVRWAQKAGKVLVGG